MVRSQPLQLYEGPRSRCCFQLRSFSVALFGWSTQNPLPLVAPSPQNSKKTLLGEDASLRFSYCTVVDLACPVCEVTSPTPYSKCSALRDVRPAAHAQRNSDRTPSLRDGGFRSYSGRQHFMASSSPKVELSATRFNMYCTC